MNKLFALSFIMFSVFAQQCVTFEKVSLDDGIEDSGTSDDEKGIPATAFKGGNLMDGNWWTGTTGDMSLNNKGGVFEIKCNGIGPAYTPLGMEMGAVDFTGDVVIRMKARSEGENTPVMALQFDDFEGFQANGARPTKRIHIGDDFKDYCFKVDKSVWSQTWPENHSVNGALISKVMFFPNPGGPAYTGTIFISEIQVINASEGCNEQEVKLAVGANGGPITSFDQDQGKDWWVSDGFKKSFIAEDTALKFEATNVGPAWNAFGTGLPKTMNVVNANKLHVWAKIDGDVPPEVRIDLKDPDGFTTNARPSTVRVFPGTEYKKYTFRFKDRFLQTYPDRHDVDGRRMTEMVCFINGGKAPWTGNLYIKKMEFEFTGEVAEEAGEGGDEEGSIEIKDDPTNTLVDDFKQPLYSWWNGDNLKLEKDGNSMVVTASGVGKNNEAFGRAFQSIDFTKTPVLKVRAKADKELTLRVDLKDIDEVATNAKPVTQKIQTGDYVDYYFDFTNKFDQSVPTSGKVNAKEILETVFFINAGGPEFSGKLFVEHISAVKKEDIKK